MEYTITLGPQLDAFLQAKIATGEYRSPTELIRDALYHLVETETDARLLHSLAQAEAGEDLDMEVVFGKLEQRFGDTEPRRPA